MIHTTPESQIPYSIRVSSRCKYGRITFKNGLFEVVIPPHLKEDYGHKFMAEKQAWAQTQLNLLQQKTASFEPRTAIPTTTEGWLEAKCQLKKIVKRYIAKHHNALGAPKQLKIKNMTSRWGSLSSKQNMNINLMLYFAPEFVIEYVVVHELCHLTHMNHSNRFWQLVAQNDPHYAKAERWLKTFGNTLLSMHPKEPYKN